VTVVDPDPDLPYDRPPLSKGFLGSDRLRPDAPWWDERCTVLPARAVRLDADGPAVEAVRADGSRACVTADHVVIATGARPATFPGQPEGVLSLRSAQDARTLRALAVSRPAVAIVGAGAIGTELASSLHQAGCSVDVLDLAPSPLARMFGSHLGGEAAAWIIGAGVGLHLGERLHRVARRGQGWVVTTASAEVTADLVLSAVGVQPQVDWLGSAGLALVDGVRCDEDGTALTDAGEGLPWLHAIGDVAAWPEAEGLWRRREDWTSAQRQARRVAHHILGVHDELDPGALPYFWTHQFDRRIQILGAPDPRGRLVQHSKNPERRAAFYTIESGDSGGTTAWVAINEPRLFARALRDQRAVHV
jgi:3-phenylpropionate/trans-cinnamate dioxygenase ferredoxin reductase subunit